jgi:two-component system sensor histidine kinase KdpD
LGFTNLQKHGTANQYLISVALITITAVTCYFSVSITGYRVVALILLLAVSLLAMLFDIFPVLITAILSALIWNYFFIPPTHTFTIESAEDSLLFIMYFVIALVNAVLTFKIRQFEKKARDKEEREKSIKLYNTLLSSLSHELRTPISTIIGSIDMIRENDSRISAGNRNELYREIAKAGFRLNRQVNNLLNMSRLEGGVLHSNKDWCDVNELVYAVIKNNIDDALHHTILFEANEKLPLYNLDRGLIEQVLHNILHNALQYTPENSVIHIEVAQNNGSCQFTISDNGKGFPENEIRAVFDKFYRLPKTAAGGIGLGLSIAKGFTEALNGTIKLENIETGGAKFIIEIPAEISSINALNDE